MWAKEEIPDEDYVYIRVAHSFVSKDKMPRASAFSNTPKEGDNLSCDWAKYCTPQSSRELVGRQKKSNGEYKDSSQFFFWNMNVGAIRSKIIPLQIVEHDPVYNNPEIDGIPNNRAHSIIIGEKENNAEFRAKMVMTGEWVIGPETIE